MSAALNSYPCLQKSHSLMRF